MCSGKLLRQYLGIPYIETYDVHRTSKELLNPIVYDTAI